MGHGTLETTCDEVAYTKEINIINLIVDVMPPYNIILGRSFMNALKAVISTQYLVLKYPLPRECVCIIRGNQQISQEFY